MKKLIIKNCSLLGCKNMFEVKNSWHRYCGKRCNKISWHLKKAKELRRLRNIQKYQQEKCEQCGTVGSEVDFVFITEKSEGHALCNKCLEESNSEHDSRKQSSSSLARGLDSCWSLPL